MASQHQQVLMQQQLSQPIQVQEYVEEPNAKKARTDVEQMVANGMPPLPVQQQMQMQMPMPDMVPQPELVQVVTDVSVDPNSVSVMTPVPMGN